MSEEVIYRCQSAYNTIIVRRDDEGIVTLQFEEEGACQSALKPDDPAYLELPYSRVLPLFLGIVPEPSRMMIVGLGGGTLPRFFRRFFPEMTIDVVEIDPAVLEVAERFCGLKVDEQLRVHIADGRDFIESAEAKYDVIVLDGFDGDFVPYHLRTLEFLEAVKAALTEGGLAVANVWGRKHNTGYDDVVATYRAAFPGLYILDVPAPGTKIFLGLPRPLPFTRSELIRAAEPVFRLRGFGFSPSEVIAGFRTGEEEAAEPAKILRD